jgi:mannose-1-phosphate guanylyltransferase
VKAIVLVGGEGTRMRPLTETIPKSLIPLVDRPFLQHVMERLVRHGVHEALLSSPYLASVFRIFLESLHGEPHVSWITEPMPLGTGGAVANAARGLDETFLVLNGDVLTDLDLGELVAVHRERGAVATIALSPVDDARPYGLVALDDHHRIIEFREKPSEPVPGFVNAGTYVLEPAVLAEVPLDRSVSIEREVFPALIASGAPVLGFESDAYWMDLGTPEKYLRATFDVLEGRVHGLSYAAPWVDPHADISLRAHLGRWVVVGSGVTVGSEAEIEDSVLLAGASIGAGARIRDSVIGPGAIVGERALVVNGVLAEEASVAPGTESEGARVGAGRQMGAKRSGASP